MIRYFVLLSTLFLIQCTADKKEVIVEIEGPTIKLTEDYNVEMKPFYHGVASGDPMHDRVIIWTKVTIESDQDIDVGWVVAADNAMKNVVRSGYHKATATSNHTVKIDVTGLIGNTTYYYQFMALGSQSVIGQTKTLPKGNTESVKLGVVSCSNYEWGYFNSYRFLGEKNVDAVLHLGDYIYEYAPGKYGDTTIGRIVRPTHEIISIDDYRERYSQYRLDSDLQEIHRKHPFINIWDDHEVSNNSYIDGAQNHQDDEGDYQTRKAVAKKAYYEWIPIREGEKHYRSFDFGTMAKVIMLDERLEGRTAPPASFDDINDDARMLGETQLNWFYDQMNSSEPTWKIIGNSVMFADLDLTGIYDSRVNLDAWDGFPYEKNAILSFLNKRKIAGTVFLTGDTHSSWAFEVPLSMDTYKRQQRRASGLAIELGTPSVNSANSDENVGRDTVLQSQQLIQRLNPHLKYINLMDHGYMILTLDNNMGKADWYYVDNLRSREANETLAQSITFDKSTKKLMVQ